MNRMTRYQGAIIHNDKILLIKHHHYKEKLEYWIFPGGGRDEGESEEECVKREVKEETNLDVVVEGLLAEISGQTDTFYQIYKTYLCKPLTFDAKPGFEPESGVGYEISKIGWFDLYDELNWFSINTKLPVHIKYIEIFNHTLKLIQKSLGYNTQKS